MRAIADRIEIKPIPNRENIKEFSPQLEFFGLKHTIGCFVNRETFKFDTNLDEEDIAYLKENGFPYDVSDTYIAGKAHSFWDSSTSKITLMPEIVILRPKASLLDFVKFRYLQKSKHVYLSEAEMLQGTKPQATHFIYNESEEIKVKATFLEAKNMLNEKVNNLSPQQKRDFILIILNENTDNKDADYLTVRMDDILNDKEASKLLSSLLGETKESITLAAIIRKAIQMNVLRRTGQGIFYFENNLGFREDDVKEFLEKEENQEILISIQTKIN